jgi:hypothetical protein
MSNTPNSTPMTASELAEILFASRLQESDHPSAEQVRIAIHDRYGASGEDRLSCIAVVAQEAGDHPETYMARMRWALTTVSQAYPDLATAA